jgi:hypothetical protein
MDERNFQINGKEFSLNKIDLFKQFHIARKIGPIIADLIPAAAKINKIINENSTQEEQLAAFAPVLQPIMDGFAKLSEADANYVLMGLLEAIEIKQVTGNFAFVARNNVMMVQDIEMPEMLQLAGRALMYNMKGFFSSAVLISKEGTPKQKGK